MSETSIELSQERGVEIDERNVNVIDVSSDEDEEMEDPENVTQVPKSHDKPINTPLKTIDTNHTESANKKTTKQLQREQEKLERERKREEEKLEKERKKEEERKLKKQKRKQKELERERIKKEREAKLEQQKKEREAKLEQQRKEKEEREAQRLKEKEEKEQQRLKEKLDKEREREQKELEKKKTEEAQKKKQKKLQISNFFKPKAIVKSVTVSAAKVDQANISFYEKTFNEFYLRENAEMHTFNRLKGEQLKASISEFDSGLKSGSSDLKSWFQNEPQPAIEPFQRDAKYIYENSLENAPLRIKFIKFYENVKSWNGSYTKPVPKTLAINPFQETEECFIDWDDEGDENEEGEGEDISENDEEDEDEDEDDDIGDFLEQDQQSPDSLTRISGPLIPKISWKGENETRHKIEILKANISFPINPLGNFWDTPPVKQTPSKHHDEAQESPNAKKPKSLITDKSDLEKFAKEVNESEYTIPTMVEILKRQFPNYTKSTIENTLRNLAKRVGPKSTERKWQVNTELLNKLIE